jgi:predicted dithiol-disulfide oxidoreductase (DUF899 family)
MPSFLQIVSHQEWLAAQKEHMAKEEALNKATEELNAKVRDLPMEKIDKEYIFEGRDGKITLSDIFHGRKQ